MNTVSSGSGRVDDIKGHSQGEIRGQTKLVKTIPRLLLVSLLSLAMASAEQALAGDCASGKCPFTSVAPSMPPAPATTASTSRGFTAIGGTRVADVNLSPEGLARLNAGDKEEPLPKGCSTAADRAKLFAEPLKPRKSFAHVVMMKPREAKPFTRRSVARPVPRKRLRLTRL
jgi:hypothetical protein